MTTYVTRARKKNPLAIACALLLSLPAIAADADNTLEEIIVTASKR